MNIGNLTPGSVGETWGEGKNNVTLLETTYYAHETPVFIDCNKQILSDYGGTSVRKSQSRSMSTRLIRRHVTMGK
jgi:hypothetical protein